MIVTLKGVGKSFGDSRPVLSGIDLDVKEGEFVSLIGPSGCGKSTLLRLVAGILNPTSGQIVFDTGDTLSKDFLSFVFQEPTLLPWLTASKNVELPLKIQGADAEERINRSMYLLDKVGLGDFANSYPRQLSGGMKMRVSIARALSVEPQLLLLDEPFGALDEMTRDALNEELLRIRSINSWTALFVTHSVSEAVFLSSRVLVMAARPGRIADVLDVPLPYPRTRRTRESIEFGELVREVTKSLHSVKADTMEKHSTSQTLEQI